MTENILPIELVDLDAKYYAFRHWKGDGPERVTFIDQLLLATKAHAESQSTLVQDKLGEHWLNHLTYYLDFLGTSFKEIPVNEMDLFIEFLDKHVSLIERLSDKGAVACACLLRAHQRGQGHVYPKEHNLRHLLRQWSGRDVPREALFNLEAAVGFIYGPACWSLYGDDVKRPTSLPRYLWKLQLPLAIGQSNQRTQQLDGLDMPGDFS